HFRMNRLSRECSTMVENSTLRHFLVACYSEANLTYSRWVKTPVITPGNVYSATYLGLTVASANNQNNGISAKLLNLWSPTSRSRRALSLLSTTVFKASIRSSI